MKAAKLVLWILLIGITAIAAVAAFFWVIVELSVSHKSEPTNAVVYAASCGVSLNLNITPNWLEGDVMSFGFYYNGHMLSSNLLPNNFPTPLDKYPDKPIEVRPFSSGQNEGAFDSYVVARNGIFKSDFDAAADCIAGNLVQFNNALATLGSRLPTKDQSFYIPHPLGALVYVP